MKLPWFDYFDYRFWNHNCLSKVSLMTNHPSITEQKPLHHFRSTCTLLSRPKKANQLFFWYCKQQFSLKDALNQWQPLLNYLLFKRTHKKVCNKKLLRNIWIIWLFLWNFWGKFFEWAIFFLDASFRIEVASILFIATYNAHWYMRI